MTINVNKTAKDLNEGISNMMAGAKEDYKSFHTSMGKKEIVKRIGYELPKLEIIGSDILQGEFEFKVTNYQSHESLKAKLSN